MRKTDHELSPHPTKIQETEIWFYVQLWKIGGFPFLASTRIDVYCAMIADCQIMFNATVSDTASCHPSKLQCRTSTEKKWLLFLKPL